MVVSEGQASVHGRQLLVYLCYSLDGGEALYPVNVIVGPTPVEVFTHVKAERFSVR